MYTKQTLLSLVCFWLFLSVGSLKGTHIVGGEIYYECLGPASPGFTEYKVYINMLRDCLEGEAAYDDFIEVFVFRSNDDEFMQVIEIDIPSNIPEIVPEEFEECMGFEYGSSSEYPLCVQSADYVGTVVLEDIPGGYDLGWARCCRNSNISNLQFPLREGMTFTAHVTGTDEGLCNNSAVFNDRLPIFICANQTFSFDHSATDPDGDDLVYLLRPAYTGLNFQGLGASDGMLGNKDPIVDPFFNPMGASPYQNVLYLNGFSPNGPFGFNTASIDPVSGFLTFSPTATGIYVVVVAVQEWKSGLLVNETRVDLQIHVLNCLEAGEPPIISHDFSGVDTTDQGISINYGSNDTIYAVAGTPFCYNVTIEDTADIDDILDGSGLSTVFSEGATFTIYEAPNPIKAKICWTPNCDRTGETIAFVKGGNDESTCRGQNSVLDSVFVFILDPPEVFPELSYDLTNTNYNGDTIILNVTEDMCFDWWVTEPSGQGQLAYDISVFDLSSGSPYAMSTSFDRDGSGLVLQTCYYADCDAEGKVFMIEMVAWDNSVCPPDHNDIDTLYLKVPLLPNPPPTVNSDLSGNILDNDTILVDVHGSLCYNTFVQDTFPSNFVFYSYSITDYQSGGFSGSSPQLTVLNTHNPGDSLEIEVCWMPDCNHVNGFFQLIIEGYQLNGCEESEHIYDTTYIRVNEIIAPAPMLTVDYLPGTVFSGDTITIEAKESECFEAVLEDTSFTNNYLEISVDMVDPATGSPLFMNSNLEVLLSSNNLIKIRYCSFPECEDVDQLVELQITGRDTFECNPDKWVYDTLFLNIIEPSNSEPDLYVVETDSTVQNGTWSLLPRGKQYCYEMVLTDPDIDPQSALLEVLPEGQIFDESFPFENNATVELVGTNPVNIKVCWDPSCYESGRSWELKICGRDTSKCGLTETKCETVRIVVDSCKIKKENVFSPNGDGINDLFIPYDVQGVKSYTLWIYDRWGNELLMVQNAGWDGKLTSGKEAGSGVYFWRAEYEMYEGKGPFIRDEFKAGHLTLLK